MELLEILVIKLSPVEGLNSSMIRTLALCRGMILLGHKVTVLTIPLSDSHVFTNQYDFLNELNIIRTSQNKTYDSISSKSNKGSIQKSLVNMIRKMYQKFSLYDYTQFIAKKVNISLLEKKDYDLVISVSDPKTSHIAMSNLIKQGLSYGKWIQYWGDPMAIDISKKSIYPKWILKRVEKNLLNGADKIVYVSPITLKEQLKNFSSQADKMCFLPIPYIQEKWFENKKNKKFTIGYFGAYKSTIRNILPLYGAVEKMPNDVNLNILGDTDFTLEERENIKIYPRGDIKFFEEEADILVCMLNKKGTQIPGKVYHYAATNKPVLILLDGDNQLEIKKYLSSFERFIICENKIESIVGVLTEIKDSSLNFTPCKEFNPKLIAEKMLHLIK